MATHGERENQTLSYAKMKWKLKQSFTKEISKNLSWNCFDEYWKEFETNKWKILKNFRIHFLPAKI